jgi:hypothetical protein
MYPCLLCDNVALLVSRVKGSRMQSCGVSGQEALSFIGVAQGFFFTLKERDLKG